LKAAGCRIKSGMTQMLKRGFEPADEIYIHHLIYNFMYICVDRVFLFFLSSK